MHKLVLVIAVAASIGGVVPAFAGTSLALGSADQVAHGGGCRKSSPPGQCCHMNNSTGQVHCH